MSDTTEQQALEVIRWAVAIAERTEQDELWHRIADPVHALLLARAVIAAEGASPA